MFILFHIYNHMCFKIGGGVEKKETDAYVLLEKPKEE